MGRSATAQKKTLTDICLQEGTLLCSFAAFRANTLLISMSYFQCDEGKLRSTVHMLLLQSSMNWACHIIETKTLFLYLFHMSAVLTTIRFTQQKSHIHFRHCTSINFINALFRGMTRLPEVKCELRD